MRVTIIYDNTSYRKDLTDDWGFAALVEAWSRKILFDTGGSGYILLENMEKLKIDPQGIDDIFISHAHFDHIGGLSTILDLKSDVSIWIPRSLRGVRKAQEVIEIEHSDRLYEGLYTTGELEGIEQSLCVKTERGIVIVAGCSHPAMEVIIEASSQFGEVYGIIGGLHGNRPESLNVFQLICATHCTQYRDEIRSLYPDRYIEGGAGQVIEIA
jgi:7,8-dihydropterin-6-yl-methyl-4-(beta-D-ribofuranosyl)aminobenzene 5'-phosphate synthase